MTTLTEARILIRNREEFKAASVIGTWVRPDRYAVFSYGPHWPLAVWTQNSGWVRNSTKYHRPTTNRHAALVWLALDYIDTATADVEAMRELSAGRQDRVVAPQPHLTYLLLNWRPHHEHRPQQANIVSY